VIFIEEPEVQLMTEYQQQNRQTVKELLSCYHVEEEALDEDDPRNIQITEIGGEREVEGVDDYSCVRHPPGHILVESK
jgi:hypothetical protein